MTQPHHNTVSRAVFTSAWTEFCRTDEGRQEYWRRFKDYLFTGREIPRELYSQLPPTFRSAFRNRQRRPSLARLVAKAKQLGVDVTVEPNGAATFRCSSAASDVVINEWDEVLPRHVTH